MTSVAPPPGLPGNLGLIEAPFVIGMMVSCVLFGITAAQTVYYYRMYGGDEVYVKILVGVLFLLEAAHQALVGEAVHFLYIVSKVPENIQGIFFVRSTFAVSFALTVVITSLVQIFYAWRVWIIAPEHESRKPVVASILLLSFMQFCMGFATDGLLYTQPALTTIHQIRQQVLYSFQLGLSMLCDFIITLALIHYLNKSRSGFHSTENVIDRLIMISVKVGLLTSAVAVVTFVTFHALKNSTMFTLFTEIISKIYVNSLLATLNSRNSFKLSSEYTSALTYQSSSFTARAGGESIELAPGSTKKRTSRSKSRSRSRSRMGYSSAGTSRTSGTSCDHDPVEPGSGPGLVSGRLPSAFLTFAQPKLDEEEHGGGGGGGGRDSMREPKGMYDEKREIGRDSVGSASTATGTRPSGLSPQRDLEWNES